MIQWNSVRSVKPFSSNWLKDNWQVLEGSIGICQGKNGISFIIWLFFNYLIHVSSMFCHMILWNEKMSNVWQNLVCSHTFLFLMLSLCIHPNCIEKAYIVLFTMWCWTFCNYSHQVNSKFPTWQSYWDVQWKGYISFVLCLLLILIHLIYSLSIKFCHINSWDIIMGKMRKMSNVWQNLYSHTCPYPMLASCIHTVFPPVFCLFYSVRKN